MNPRKWSLFTVVVWCAVFSRSAVVGGSDGFAPPKGSFAELKREWEQADAARRPKLEARYRQAKSDAERQAIREELRELVRSAFRQAHAWAEAHASDPEAIDALVWIAQDLGGYVPWYDNEIERTFDLLTAMALRSDKIAMVCYTASNVSYSSPSAKRFLVTALERSPSRIIRGVSCLSLGRHFALLASLCRKLHDPIFGKPGAEAHAQTPRGFLQELEHSDPDALDGQAEAYLERVVAEFGDVKMPEPYFQTPLGEIARGDLFKLKNLGVG